jgi:hypothetical protein
VSCALTTVNNQLRIDLYLSTPQTVTNAVFIVQTLGYQISFISSPTTIYSGLPSAIFLTTLSVSINPVALQSTLTMTSSKVNTLSNYYVKITPISQSGYIGISLPSFIINQLSSSPTTTTAAFSVNGSNFNANLSLTNTYAAIIPITPATTNITLTIYSILNPLNSQPYSLALVQSQDTAFTKIYGSNSYTISMTQFDPITVTSVVRNATKIGVASTFITTITSPDYIDNLVINFPTSQAFTQTTCSITVNALPINCSVINSTAILTTNIPGTATYTISGLYNQKYYSLTAKTDLVQVSIGYPYTRA